MSAIVPTVRDPEARAIQVAAAKLALRPRPIEAQAHLQKRAVDNPIGQTTERRRAVAGAAIEKRDKPAFPEDSQPVAAPAL